MKVSIDWNRAQYVFDTLIGAFRNKSYPYDRVFPPQIKENLPQNLVWGSREHANFLFHSCYYMRGGIQSDEAFRRLSSIYSEHPAMFNPETFEKEPSLYDSKNIVRILQEHRLGYHKQIAGFWIKNAHKLNLFWKGSPLSVFEKAKDYEDLCKILIANGKREADKRNGFHGFQYKMVSMLVYFYVDALLIDPISFPIPVDFHVLRILTANKLLVVEGMESGMDLFKDEYKASARELTEVYCIKNAVSPVELCEALWLLSRTLCVLNPGNSSVVVGKLSARRTEVQAKKIIKSS